MKKTLSCLGQDSTCSFISNLPPSFPLSYPPPCSLLPLSYYQLEEIKSTPINSFLSNIIEKALSSLESSFCLEIEEDDRTLHPLTLGCIASYYYLHHSTVKLFRERLHSHCSFEELLQLLAVRGCGFVGVVFC